MCCGRKDEKSSMRLPLVIHPFVYIIVKRYCADASQRVSEPVQSVGASEYSICMSHYVTCCDEVGGSNEQQTVVLTARGGLIWSFWNCVGEIINNQQSVVEVNTLSLCI